ncbi:MAG: hypothetical protein HS111_29200 [Kofleriaceae bacterium]|nr:hypothetical protein [Kofleriaceae bacterium]
MQPPVTVAVLPLIVMVGHGSASNVSPNRSTSLWAWNISAPTAALIMRAISVSLRSAKRSVDSMSVLPPAPHAAASARRRGAVAHGVDMVVILNTPCRPR